MEKIEKLQEFNWLEGRDSLTIAFDNTIIRKVNEIIDHLNSQDQEEENTVCEGCGKTITSRFMQSYTKGDGMHSYCLSCDPEKQDTPGEWEDRIRDLILDISADRLVSSEKVVAIVQSLLDDREREVLDTVLGELPEGVIKELKLGGHPDPIGRDGFPGNFDGNYEKLYEGIVDRLEEVQTKYANLIYSIKKGINNFNSKKK